MPGNGLSKKFQGVPGGQSQRMPRRSRDTPLEPLGQSYQNDAIEFFPEDPPAVAVAKFARDHWLTCGYFWENGRRVICAEDVDYYHRVGRKTEVKLGESNRAYLVTKDLPTLDQIDLPKRISGQAMVKHTSEYQSGWALPRDHRRHLLNFSQEILDMIYHHTLTVEAPDTISPDIPTTNWRRVYKPDQNYSIQEQNVYSRGIGGVITSTIVMRREEDPEGPFWSLHKVRRQAIDATLLRTCKSIHSNVSRVLYGENVFKFKMTDFDRNASPPFWYNDEEHFRDPEKPWYTYWPFFSSTDAIEGLIQVDIDEAIDNVEQRTAVNSLYGYVYHDHFLRFLHAIGQNAKLIKTLMFSGTAFVHRCLGKCRSQREEDLLYSMRWYIPCINKFCPGLEKLIIDVRWDSAWTEHRFIDPENPTPEEKYEQVLTQFLQTEVRKLKTVRVLDIHVRDEVSKCAEDTMQWFKNRAYQWAREEEAVTTLETVSVEEG